MLKRSTGISWSTGVTFERDNGLLSKVLICNFMKENKASKKVNDKAIVEPIITGTAELL